MKILVLSQRTGTVESRYNDVLGTIKITFIVELLQ